MNLALISRLLGLVALLIGGSMAFSLPWASPWLGGDWRYEQRGMLGLLGAMGICFVVAGGLRWLGRNGKGQLYRKEAMAVVGLSWVLATVLGALPFELSVTYRAPAARMSVVDAMFEAQSGFSTTGATVITDLEDPALIPRCILFWRSSTHFLGGLGIIVLFVAILGQGSAGKALMRTEMPGPSHHTPQARMQHTAWVLFFIYTGLNVALTLILMLEGLTVFDALCHAFGTMATGGFSTYNASIGHFATVDGLNAPLIEMTIVAFMILAGTNFMLLYFVVLMKPLNLFRDVEWRVYLSIIGIVTLAVIFFGLYEHDFDRRQTAEQRAREIVEQDYDAPTSAVLPPKSNGDEPGGTEDTASPTGSGGAEPGVLLSLLPAVRYGLFQVVSIMTTTGFVTDDFDIWNSFGRGVLLMLMFVGGCAGSTGGGMKVIRHILFFKILRLEIEQAFHPTVVRPLRLAGEPLADQDLRRNILVYFGLVGAIFALCWLVTITVEPNSTWTDHGHSVEHKLIDAASAVAATLNNIGPGLGVVGATKNYTNFTPVSKILFTWLMMIGRLEVYVILVLFVPGFWRSQ